MSELSEKMSSGVGPTSEDPDEDEPLLKFSAATMAARRMRAKKTQAIAHRGYKAIYPENTMLSFKGAGEAGAHAIETDLHLTRDGVVVISHDATLKRCFGVDRKIIDCDWEEIKTLRTLKEPGQPMPTLREVVEYLATSELEAKGVWLLLDIKIDSPADDIMRLTAETISKVHEGTEYWGGRIVLGCWTLKYLPLCEKYLPGFPIVHIGYSIPYAQQFLDHQDVGVNMFWPVMQTAAGKAFLEELKDAGRSVFVWNINNDAGMKWAIANEYIDGVCTDDPVKFLKLCEGYTQTWLHAPPATLSNWAHLVVWNIVAVFLSVYFKWKYGSSRLAINTVVEKGDST